MGTGYESQARVAWGTGCPPTVDTETVVRQARGDTSDCCSPGPLAGQSPGWPAGRQCALLVMGVDLAARPALVRALVGGTLTVPLGRSYHPLSLGLLCAEWR